MSEADVLQEEAFDPRHQGFLVNVNLVFISSFAVNVLSFAIVVAIARLLGPDGRGVTSLYQTGINGAYAFVSFGVAVGALYYVSRSEVTPRQAMEAGLTGTLGSAILAGAGVVILGLAAGPQLRDAGVPYWTILIAIPLVVQFRLVEVILRAEGHFMAVSVMELMVPATVLIGFLAVELGDGLTISRAIVIWSLSPLLSTLLGYWLLGRSAIPRRFALDATSLRIMRFGLQGQMGNIVQLLNYRLDSYLVLLFVDAAGVGIYSVGVALSEGLWLVANSVAIVLIPKLAASSTEYAGRTSALVSRSTILITALGAGALAIVSPVLVPLLFGAKFDDSIVPLLCLLPGVVALSGTKVLSAYVFSQGKPLTNAWIGISTLAITLIGDFALIPWLGVPGAAIASSIAYTTSLVLTLRAYSRLSGLPALKALLPQSDDVGMYVDGARSVIARLRRPASPGAGAAIGG